MENIRRHAFQSIVDKLEDIDEETSRKIQKRVLESYLKDFHLDYTLADLDLDLAATADEYYQVLLGAIGYDYDYDIFSDTCDEVLESVGLTFSDLSDIASGNEYEYLTDILYQKIH